MKLDILKRYDFSFFFLMSLIFTIGVLNLYSATHAHTVSHMSNLYKMQLGWYCACIVIAFVASFIGPKNLFKLSYPIYFLNVILLILVLILGDEAMGGKRWLVLGPLRLQPSEPMKISLVLALSRWFSKVDPHRELGLKDLIIPFLIAFIPTLLIVKEPDLGTGLLHMLIFAVIALYRKLKVKSIVILGIIGILCGSVMYKFGLKEYQRQRILTFIDPTADAKGSGYNAIQSEIAIGSGKFSGKGFMKSSQASLNYLPENHTDFVFSILNEEWGFLGSIFLIALYVFLMFRFIRLSQSVLHFYDSIVCIGLMSILFWHTFINMCMVMGLMPIVGLPLPLMSYGGSSLLLFLCCGGIATSLSNSRNFF